MNKNEIIQKLLKVISLLQLYPQVYPTDEEELLLMITDITKKIEIKLLNNVVEILKKNTEDSI